MTIMSSLKKSNPQRKKMTKSTTKPDWGKWIGKKLHLKITQRKIVKNVSRIIWNIFDGIVIFLKLLLILKRISKSAHWKSHWIVINYLWKINWWMPHPAEISWVFPRLYQIWISFVLVVIWVSFAFAGWNNAKSGFPIQNNATWRTCRLWTASCSAPSGI